MYYAPLSNDMRELPEHNFVVPLQELPRTGPNTSFIPGTKFQFVYDSVSLGLIKGCLRKYKFKMLDGWDWETRPAPLSWGANFHTCIETYHKVVAHGLEHEVAVLRCARLALLLGERLISNDTTRTKETLVRAVVWYLDQYKDDPLRTAMLPNGKPAVELSFMLPIFDVRLEPTDELPELDFEEVVAYAPSIDAAIKAVAQGRKLFGKLVGLGRWAAFVVAAAEASFYSVTIYLSGHIDRVVHFGDEVFVSDYKTAKSALDSNWLAKFQPSNQFRLYYTAGQILSSLPNTVFPRPPAGVIVDGIQLGVNFNRFSRFPMRFTSADADNFLEDFEAIVRIKALGAAQLGHWPGEEDAECHKYNGCEFLCVCTKSPREWERQLRSNFVKSIWDPRKPR